MPVVKVVKGDILEANEKYIGQQCNCVTVKSHGLSKSIADKYPWADVYRLRAQSGNRNCCVESDRSTPGTIQKIYGHNKVVVCLFGQYCPGKVGVYNNVYGGDETLQDRENWFKQCIKQIDHDEEIDVIALPYYIGCGLAGGRWEIYSEILMNSSKNIVLYKL